MIGLLLFLNLIIMILAFFELLSIRSEMDIIKYALDIDDNDSSEINILDIDYEDDDYDEEQDEDNDINIDDTFNNVFDFIDYVSDNNLEIVDIANRKIRKIKHLENCECNNQETVFITFEDNTMAVFIPFLFAKCNKNNKGGES